MSSENHPANLGTSALQIGGLVVVPVVTSASGVFGTDIYLLFAILGLFVMGAWDDRSNLSVKIRLVIQLVISAVIAWVLVYQNGAGEITLSLQSFPRIFLAIPVFLVLVYLMNAANFVDGADLALTANIFPGFLMFTGLFVLGYLDSPVNILILSMCGGVLAFAILNKPPAKVYFGDAGSIPIGFLCGLASVIIFIKYGSIAGILPFSYMILDVGLTLLKRLIGGANIFSPHSEHAFHVALKGNLSVPAVAMLIGGATSINTVFAAGCFFNAGSIAIQAVFCLLALLNSLGLYLYFSKAR